MLELRPACENCNTPLPPDSTEALICPFECTFCRSCVENILDNVCPNCGGGVPGLSGRAKTGMVAIILEPIQPAQPSSIVPWINAVISSSPKQSNQARRNCDDPNHARSELRQSLSLRATDMDQPRKFSARVFLCAGIYGFVALAPQYFLEGKLGRDFPPPLTHPEHFYGFIGVALAWQFVFLIIAHDVQRYRLFMLPAILEKLSFGVATLVLCGQGRVAAFVAGAGIIDLLLAVFFLLAFRASRKPEI